jgi:hypothetical protein
VSSSNTGTNYTFSMNVDSGTLSINGGFQMSTGADSNDALALEILQALKGVDWPTGVTNPVSVSKVVDTAVVYAPNLASTPPSFT